MTSNQRWRERRSLFRPAEPINPRAYDVALIPGDATARTFVQTHHYSGSYPAARVRCGLYHRGDLAGVAVFSVPIHPAVVSGVFGPLAPARAVELGRFVLLDEVPGNGETWFLARCFALLRRLGFAAVISHADPTARTTEDNREVFPGHVGTIYQAFNARYVGRSQARTLKLLPDATVLSDRTHQKMRAGERGWQAGAHRLIAFGADPIAADADQPARIAWLQRWTARLTRPLRHPGTHKYVWTLARDAEVTLPALRYPKRNAA